MKNIIELIESIFPNLNKQENYEALKEFGRLYYDLKTVKIACTGKFPKQVSLLVIGDREPMSLVLNFEYTGNELVFRGVMEYQENLWIDLEKDTKNADAYKIEYRSSLSGIEHLNRIRQFVDDLYFEGVVRINYSVRPTNECFFEIRQGEGEGFETQILRQMVRDNSIKVLSKWKHSDAIRYYYKEIFTSAQKTNYLVKIDGSEEYMTAKDILCMFNMAVCLYHLDESLGKAYRHRNTNTISWGNGLEIVEECLIKHMNPLFELSEKLLVKPQTQAFWKFINSIEFGK